jgi:hypothetical protein
LLRRRERFADPVLRHGDVELNRMERRVTRNGRVVELTTKEFSLLEFLMHRKGSCCTRSELKTQKTHKSHTSIGPCEVIFSNCLLLFGGRRSTKSELTSGRRRELRSR